MIPGVVYVGLLFIILNYGLKHRLYMQYIKHGRRSDLVDRFDIDLDDIESYPASVFDEYVDKKRKESELKIKED